MAANTYGEDFLMNQLNNISSSLFNYMAIIVCPVGVVLNMFSFYVFSRPRLNKTNMGFLYRWQSAVDIALLLITTFVMNSFNVFGISFANTSDFLCRFLTFLRRFILHASSWMTLFITFDRFMAVRLPTKLTELRKNKLHLSLVILAMFALIALVDVENLFYYLEQTELVRGNQTTVRSVCTASPLVYALSDIISIVMRTYVPFVLMTVFDALIVRRIVQSKNKSNRSSGRREKHFTAVVLAYNCVFFALNFPLSVIYIFTTIYNLAHIELDPLPNAIFRTAFTSTVVLAFFMQATSFVFNFTLNYLFRNEILIIFRIRGPNVASESSTITAQSRRDI
nr:G protein-coupled receptor [Proales similis]